MYQDINVIQSSGFTSEQAATVDYLTKGAFRLNIPNCPLLSQTATKCPLPKINTGAATQLSPTLSIPHIGDSLLVAPFIVTFPVLSDLSNYLEVFNWMCKIIADDLATARSPSLTRLNVLTVPTNNNSKLDLSSFYTDGSLIFYDRNNNPTTTINFLGMVPTDLSQIDFDANSTSQDPILATVTFRYMYHTITPHTQH